VLFTGTHILAEDRELEHRRLVITILRSSIKEDPSSPMQEQLHPTVGLSRDVTSKLNVIYAK